tara:strand:+ start:5096 stop:6907 length:1812 start_codon:yes stop_codon:yes gene_type:complete
MSVQITGAQIKNNEISADKLQSNSVTAAKIQNQAITTAKIGNFAVGSSQLANSSVIAGKIATGAVSPAACDLTATWNFFSGTLQSGTPSNANDVANKGYVDGLVGSGVYWKEPARVASTGNVNISNPGTDTFDGVQIQSGDRIVLKDQSSQSENGVYDFNGSSSAMTRSSDANSADELNGLAIFIKEGSIAADQGFVQTSEIANLGSDNVVFVQFTGLGQITAGDGLDKSGNTLSVDTGAGLQIVGGAVAVESGSGIFIDANAVAVDVDDSSIEVNGSNKLQIKNDGITSAMIGTNQVTGNEIAGATVGTANLADSAVSAAKVGASAITEAKLASLSVSEAKLQNSAVSPAKLASSVAGAGLAYDAGTGLAVGVDDATIQIFSDQLRLKDLGIGSAKLSNAAVSTVKIADDAVTKAKINADVAGNGLAQDGTGALEVSVSDGLEIFSDSVAIKNGSALGFSGAGALDVKVDNATIEIDGAGNELRLKDLGIPTAKLQDAAISTQKIQDNAVTAAKVGFQAYQELTTISGSSTSQIDLAREVDSAFSNGIMVFKNGLAMLNKTALGGSAANNDEFTLSVVGGNTRLSFGASLNDGDDILVVYMT